MWQPTVWCAVTSPAPRQSLIQSPSRERESRAARDAGFAWESWLLAHHILMMSICALAAAACSGQSMPLPPAPEGVETFTRGDIEFSRVRAAGVPSYFPENAQINRAFGAGSWDFGIARTELRNSQWVSFVNAFSATHVPEDQPWSTAVGVLLSGLGMGGGVEQDYVGPEGRWIWRTTPLSAARAAPAPGWFGAAAYCNWLHNGKRVSMDDMLTGAYDLRRFDFDIATTWADVERSPDARYWIPTYDEWAVACFFDPSRDGSSAPGWWSHFNRHNRPGNPGAPGFGETSAGWENGPAAELLPVAAYPESQSAWGLLDTSGGVGEWLEETIEGTSLPGYAGSAAGPYWAPGLTVTEQAGWIHDGFPIREPYVGIRIATSEIPTAPSLACAVLAGVWASRRRRAG